jgi:hypothetical protein
VSGSNGHQNGGRGGTAPDLQQKRTAFLQSQLANTQRPARLVGLFTAKQMGQPDLERLVEVCQHAMRDENRAASLTVSPLQQGWSISVVESAETAPHDCLVQLFPVDDPRSPHHELLRHLSQLDEEMGRATLESVGPAKTYLTVASGRLDDKARIHPFQNLVALFATALGALIVDPASAMVTMDPGEWADAMEMSLEIESGMKLLRR